MRMLPLRIPFIDEADRISRYPDGRIEGSAQELFDPFGNWQERWKKPRLGSENIA